VGVPLLYGTDAGVLPHDMGAWQFVIMVERGMTPMAAIKSATSIAASHMGMGQEVGYIAPGRWADIIVVRDNPLQSIDGLKEIALVMKAGIIVRNN